MQLTFKCFGRVLNCCASFYRNIKYNCQRRRSNP